MLTLFCYIFKLLVVWKSRRVQSYLAFILSYPIFDVAALFDNRIFLSEFSLFLFLFFFLPIFFAAKSVSVRVELVHPCMYLLACIIATADMSGKIDQNYRGGTERISEEIQRGLDEIIQFVYLIET